MPERPPWWPQPDPLPPIDDEAAWDAYWRDHPEERADIAEEVEAELTLITMVAQKIVDSKLKELGQLPPGTPLSRPVKGVDYDEANKPIFVGKVVRAAIAIVNESEKVTRQRI